MHAQYTHIIFWISNKAHHPHTITATQLSLTLNLFSMADGGGGANTNNNLNNPLVDDDTDLTINQDL